MKSADLGSELSYSGDRRRDGIHARRGFGGKFAILGLDECGDLLQKNDQCIGETFKIFPTEVFVLPRIDNCTIECGQRVVITLIGLLTVAC